MNPAAAYRAMIVGLEAHGMSPVQIMRETGVKKSTYYRLRSGESQQPAYETIRPLETLARKVEAEVRR